MGAEKGWLVRAKGFDPSKVEVHGSKFLIGNGALGYRGTLEEFGAKERVAVTLAGLYDQRGQAWREPVNAPNPLWTALIEGGKPLSPLSRKPLSHSQSLDLRFGLHVRESVFRLKNGAKVTLRAERFASLTRKGLLCLRYSLQADRDCSLVLRSGIDGEVWDLNGPHFKTLKLRQTGGSLEALGITNEGGKVAVAESASGLPAKPGRKRVGAILARQWVLKAKAGEPYTLDKLAVIASSLDHRDPRAAARRDLEAALLQGYDALKSESRDAWSLRWRDSDVRIEGDEAGQLALRYSIYQLLSIAPERPEGASIPARGLSGQVYKGAIFWDTEMFMLPFFSATQPALASVLMKYRARTLAGARRKAAGLGYRGAFYAWESQESGDDACTLFNITDILTNRPLRTYFADKQIHISADVAHAIWSHYEASGDESLLLEGGAEAILECARFFMSWAHFKSDKGRYELLDVTGPDEYHERVHNNAFTNGMAARTAQVALEALALLRRRHPSFLKALLKRLRFGPEVAALKDFAARIYVPSPDKKSGLIEQFDGFFRLEDCGIQAVKARKLDEREYLGGGAGVATTTQVIKQADLMVLLHTLGGAYSAAVKKANWEYYEPRTEHGSSLSACIYALVAARIGRVEWAYRYFLKTATVDLSGDSKQYVGPLYIGGTHPAANGGAWMAAVQGFGGLRTSLQGLELEPRLPRRWKALSFRAYWRGQGAEILLKKGRFQARALEGNRGALRLKVAGKSRLLRPGESWSGRA